MSEDELQKLFAGYVKTEEAQKSFKGGTGLGLSISKQIVELMKGTLTASSEKDKGSTFTLCVPQKIQSKETIDKETAGKLLNFQYSGS